MIGNMRYDAVLAETIGIRGAGGDLVEAYAARPMDPRPHGGVVVIHGDGYAAIGVNLHFRDAPGADPDDAAAASRANGGVPDDRFVGDAAAAVAWLRDLPAANGRVGVIGFCSGGRQAFLASVELDVQAAVDCYGAFVLHEPPDGFPIRVRPLADRVGEVGAPLLGLFGNDDRNPSPAEVDELEELLRDHGKTYEFHRYDGAGHAFFSVDRPAYRHAAAADGWLRVGAFLHRHLAAA